MTWQELTKTFINFKLKNTFVLHGVYKINSALPCVYNVSLVRSGLLCSAVCPISWLYSERSGAIFVSVNVGNLNLKQK